MLQGTIKWFSCAKGYGFIDQGGGRDDIFVHYTAIRGDGYKKLRHGDQVSFELVTAAKGPQAASVTKIVGH